MGDDNRHWQVLWVVGCLEQAVVADVIDQGEQLLQFV